MAAMSRLTCFPLAAAVALAAGSLLALDYVTVKRGTSERELAGQIEVEAQDGSLLFQTPDGGLSMLLKEEIVSRRSDTRAFQPLSRDDLAKSLQAELPGFEIYKTNNYLIAYNTSDAYARWVGALFERLHAGFYNFWTTKGAELHEPEFPLVALVFKDQASYDQYARRDLGTPPASIFGYYSLTTNRMTTYDLTGVEGAAGGGPPPAAARIQQILSQPRAERTVATLIHEATHQLAFNSGLQVRFTDMPFWVSEGLAIYFETPDLQNSKGWKKIGAVNRVNLAHFRKAAATRPRLAALITDDKLFRDAKTSADAYSTAWAFTYFLIRTRREAYVKYLHALASRPLAVYPSADERLKEFQQHFGSDLPALEAEFLRHMQQIQ
jgi:hypothetical protein